MENASANLEAEREGELRLFRAICGVAAVVYPLWGLFCAVIVPGSANLLGQRLLISAVWLGLLATSYRWRLVTEHLHTALLLAFCLLTAHYGMVVCANVFSPFYVAGIFVTLGAVDVLFGDLPSFVAFSLFAGAGSVALLAAAPTSSNIGPLIVGGVATQQALFYISLRSRISLTLRLREMHSVVHAQNEQLRALDRLKDDFVKAVSHELRSPLTVVQGYGDLLRQGAAGPLSDSQHRYVDSIMAASTQLEGLVGDLLDHARIEAGTFKLVRDQVDFNEVVDEVIVSLTPQADAKLLVLQRSLPAHRVTMSIDRKRIAQVLTNLLSNAIKFTPAGGTIEVAARASAEEVRVEVRDTGRGIPSAALEHVFDRFYQVSDASVGSHVGLGLGLAIAKAIVEGHGGRIGVVSEAGIGSTFWITCPSQPPAVLTPGP